MCEEESEDHEAVAKLFEINDSIHRTLERYRLVKGGDIEAASRIPRGTLGTSGAGVRKGPDNELSLIDFGSGEDSTVPSSGAPADAGGAEPNVSQGTSLENDLIGLSLGDNTQNAGGQISLGGPAPPQQGQNAASSKQNIMNAFNSPQPSFSPQPPQQQSAFFSPPVQQQPVFSPQPPAYQPPPSLQPLPSQQPSLIQPSQPPTTTPAQPPQQRAPAPDPFAGLSSISANSTRTSSPFQFQQNPVARAPPSHPAPQTQPLSQPASQPTNGAAVNASSADDEWTFTSALPESTQELTVTNSSLHIAWHVSRPSGSNEVLIKSSTSNNTAQPVSDLTFQAAVSKAATLRMEPQSGRAMGPKARSGISQVIRVQDNGASVKVRWKVGYLLGSERKEEMGEIASLGV